MLDKVNELVVSLGGIAGITLLLKELFRLYKQSEKNSFNSITKSTFEIYKQLNRIVQKTGAAKVVILRLHNGGDKLQVGKSLYSSVTHEVTTDSLPPTADLWTKQRVDEGYIKKFMEMMGTDHRSIDIHTKALPNGLLKEVYKANRIARAMALHVYTFHPRPFKFFSSDKSENQGKMWYMVAMWKDDKEMSEEEHYYVRGCRNQIREIFKEQYKYD